MTKIRRIMMHDDPGTTKGGSRLLISQHWIICKFEAPFLLSAISCCSVQPWILHSNPLVSSIIGSWERKSDTGGSWEKNEASLALYGFGRWPRL